MQLDLYSRAGRRQDFQPEFFRNLHPARDILRLLRTQRADFLEKSLETRRRDDAQPLDKPAIAS